MAAHSFLVGGRVASGAWNKMTVFQGKDVGVTPTYDVNGPLLFPREIVLKQMVACVAKVVGSVYLRSYPLRCPVGWRWGVADSQWSAQYWHLESASLSGSWKETQNITPVLS